MSVLELVLKTIRRRLKKIFKRPLMKLMFAFAKYYRIVLGVFSDPCCIGVTGSCGKTMTKEFIAAVFRVRGRVRKSNRLYNGPYFVAQTIFTIFPCHRTCVHEMGTQEPGLMAKSVDLFHPQIAVVTNIGYDHYSVFRGKEPAAAEKGVLVESIPADGAVVLNADDPYVLAMQDRTSAAVITYGLGDKAMVRGKDISSVWPDRLSLTVTYGTEEVRVNTRLLGEHWSYCVLAAVAAGIAKDVPLADAAHEIEKVQPVEGRMSVHETSNGITFVRDDWKSPFWTVPASLEFMRTARARRRIAVIGTVSDYPGSASPKYRAIARQALQACERVFFVGDFAHCSLKARSGPTDNRIMAFETVSELNLCLQPYLQPGDLVLLKGSGRADHLQRLALAADNDVACWRQKCTKYIFCTNCSSLRRTSVCIRA